MATWKKLLVSGSSVSELVNDAGYLTSATAFNAFVTASVGGVDIIADSTTDSLNFAADSNIVLSGDAGTDTITIGVTGLISSSAQIASDISGSLSNSAIAGLGAGIVSSSAQVDYLGLSNIPSGILSASALDSPAQGEARLTLNGVAQSTVDLGLQTTDSPTFAGVTGGNITIGVTDDNSITTTSGNLNIDATTGVVAVTNNLTVGGNLTVEGDTINANVTNLDIEDRYILLNSGSSTIGDSGVVFGGSNGTAQQGAAFIWDASYNSNDGRAAIVNDMASNATGDQTPNYHLAGVFSGSSVDAATAQADHLGNIRLEAGDIWIYG